MERTLGIWRGVDSLAGKFTQSLAAAFKGMRRESVKDGRACAIVGLKV